MAVYRIIASASGDYLFEFIDLPDLNGAAVVEAVAGVKITSSDSGADKGSALSFSDGTYQYAVWLRADGLNLHGQAHVPWTLSDRQHRIRLTKTSSGRCAVRVDDMLVQTGPAAGGALDNGCIFGSFVPIIEE